MPAPPARTCSGRRSPYLVWGAFAVLSAWAAPADAASPPARAVQTPGAQAVGTAEPGWQRALLDRYCVACHNDRLRTADLALDRHDAARVADAPEIWETVVRKLRAGAMPPPGRTRPDPATYGRFVTWLEDELDQAAAENPDPGRTEAFHRLNRTEYHHAVRDLLLDAITDDLARLRREVGAGDRARVTQYLDAVRAIERRIQLSERSDTELPDLARPVGIPESYTEHVGLLFDLTALAWQADITRVFTFMLGRELNGRAYPAIGIPDSHHGISHHRYDPRKLAQLAKINTYHVTLFRRFLKTLAETPDGDGSLLDPALLLYGASLSDSNKHLHYDLPLLLVGGSGRQLRGGRHLRYPRDTPMTNLLVSQLDKAGVRLDDGLGDSTGRLRELAPLSDL